jgi:hypothetical protein
MGSEPSIDYDRLGSIASTICAIHCAISGFALSLVSALGIGFIASEGAELLFILVTLVFGVFAIRSGFRKHGKYWPIGLFLGGALLIASSHLLFSHQHVLPMSRIVSIAGAICLIAFHVVNHRLAKVA